MIKDSNTTTNLAGTVFVPTENNPNHKRIKV
jgi:hypothetical protein